VDSNGPKVPNSPSAPSAAVIPPEASALLPTSGTPAGDTSEKDAPLLLEEYKIVQVKIDKLGEDMFKVRSWCITLFTGVAAGAKLSGGLSPLVVLILAPIVLAFQLVEYRQRQIVRRSSKRARDIETLFRRLLRNANKDTSLAPRLATKLLKEGIEDKDKYTIRYYCRTKRELRKKERVEPSESERVQEILPKPNLTRCLIAQSDFIFYTAQYLIIVALLIVTSFTSVKELLKPRAEGAVLTMQLGTNSLTLSSQATNIVTTNFVVYIEHTTNFVVHVAHTTNFIVTNVPTISETK